MSKDVGVYGIETGICVYGIGEIFPQIIYTLNGGNLIEAISKCFSDSSVNKNLFYNKNSQMRLIIYWLLMIINILKILKRN